MVDTRINSILNSNTGFHPAPPHPHRKPKTEHHSTSEDIARKRLQWRLNERKARARKAQRILNLTQQNQDLEMQVASLKSKLLRHHYQRKKLPTQETTISYTSPTDPYRIMPHIPYTASLNNQHTLIKTICAYYELFAHGFAVHSPPLAATQRRFLEAIMTDTTAFMDTQGAASVLRQWKLMTDCHDSLHIQLLQCDLISPSSSAISASSPAAVAKDEDDDDDVEPCHVVRAVSTYSVRISYKTLMMLYPHLLNDMRLVHALIGLEVHATDTVHSYIDAGGKILRHDVVIDFVSALLKQEFSLDDVANVLSGSHLRSNGLVNCAAAFVQEQERKPPQESLPKQGISFLLN
jgi:hypothetical protein